MEAELRALWPPRPAPATKRASSLRHQRDPGGGAASPAGLMSPRTRTGLQLLFPQAEPGREESPEPFPGISLRVASDTPPMSPRGGKSDSPALSLRAAAKKKSAEEK